MSSAFASLVSPRPRQVKRSSTWYDARSRASVLSITTLFAKPSPNSDPLQPGKITPRRNIIRRASLHNPAVFVPASEAPIVLSAHSEHSEHDAADDAADDAVLYDIAPAPAPSPSPASATSSASTDSCNYPPFDSSTAPLPLEHTASCGSPHAGLLEALEREQLQELHARGGFAGFTAQEIEGWVVAGRAQ